MGRFSSVQSYGDAKGKLGAVPYEQAAGAGGGSAVSGGGLRVPKVENVAGSTAGAGSGDFHTYRKFRRIEAARVEAMTRRHDETLAEFAFRERQSAFSEEAGERTARHAARRHAKKARRVIARKMGGGTSGSGGGGGSGGGSGSGGVGGGGVDISGAKRGRAEDEADFEDEEAEDDESDAEDGDSGGEGSEGADKKKIGAAVGISVDGGNDVLATTTATSSTTILASGTSEFLPSDGSFLASFLELK